MYPHEIDVSCPLCGSKFRFDRLPRHRARRHSNVSAQDFEQMLIESYKSGELVVSTKRVVSRGQLTTATAALRNSAKTVKRVRSVVSGGAVESGKRR